MRDIKEGVTETHDFENWVNSILLAIFEDSVYQHSDAPVKMNDLPIGSSSKNVKRSTGPRRKNSNL